MDIYIQYILAGLIAYLLGSFPTGVIATKLIGAPDVRYSGSTHTGGTNTMQLAGAKIGALVVVIDGLKGLLAWAIAIIITHGGTWALPMAAFMAVIGHCWPLYTRFHGGMGLATGGSFYFIKSPWTIAIALPIWALFFIWIFKKKYSPRCVVIALILSVLLSVLFLNLTIDVKWMLILVLGVLVIKHIPEWNTVK